MRKSARRTMVANCASASGMLRRGNPILVARRKVAPQVFVQSGLVGVPSPAAAPVKCDVGKRIEAIFGQLDMALAIPAVRVGAMPEMEDASVDVADFALYVGVKAIAPGPIVADRAIVH